MIKNRFDLMTHEAVREATEKYEKMGIPTEAIQVHFEWEGRRVKYKLYVDLTRVYPHRRRAVTESLKGKSVHVDHICVKNYPSDWLADRYRLLLSNRGDLIQWEAFESFTLQGATGRVRMRSAGLVSKIDQFLEDQ